MTYLFYKPILLFSLLFASTPAKKVVAFHPLHVSTADISYNSQDNKLEVTCTVFTDDFELALAKQYHAKTDLQKATEHAVMDVMVRNYLNTNLHIKCGGVAAPLNYLGFEINKEATNIYLESEKVITPKKMEAEVSLLHNLYDDQLNIVHMTVNKVRKSARVDYPNKNIAQVF